MNCPNHGERQMPLFNSINYKPMKISKKKMDPKSSQQAYSIAEESYTILLCYYSSPLPLNMNGPSRINGYVGGNQQYTRGPKGKNRIIYNRGNRYNTGNKRELLKLYTQVLRNFITYCNHKTRTGCYGKGRENSNKSS